MVTRTTPDMIGPRWAQRPGVVAGMVSVLAALVVVAVLAAVVATRATPRITASPPPPAAPATVLELSSPPLPPDPPVPVRTTIAEIVGPVPYFVSPGGAAAGSVPVGSWWGTTKYLPVVAETAGWIKVRLPQRPNGLTGWIPAAGVKLSTTGYGILVDVTNHRVKLYRDGVVVVDVPAGTGTDNDPTPLGRFYVMDVAPPEGPGWGPFILDTNAHSETIASWQGSGDAFTAIHGPVGADAAIGTTGGAISHGCVRLHEADLALLSPVPPGAPVVIVA